MTYLEIYSNRSLLIGFLTLFAFSCIVCGNRKAELLIEPLHPYEDKRINTKDEDKDAHFLRYQYFTINRKLKDSLEFIPKIDSIIGQLPYTEKDTYYLKFFEKSNTLNKKYVSNYDEFPEMHIKELILVVTIRSKVDISYEYYKDGYFWSNFEEVKLVPLKDK